MNKTTIEWVRNPDGTQGYTWNVITGCLNHDNGLCKGGGFPCYAYKLANGRLKPLYLANSNWCHWNPPENGYYNPFYPRFWEERLAKLQRGIDSLDYQSYIRQSPKGIFVCDMGDLFGIGVPERWTAEILETIGDDSNSMHRFYLLTKQPQNLPQFSPFPENCWVGLTATGHAAFWKALSYLKEIKATVKYLSLEPLLEPIKILPSPFTNFEPSTTPYKIAPSLSMAGISWLIIGACTGTYQEMSELRLRYPELCIMPGDNKDTERPVNRKWTAQPRIDDLREIVEAADKVGVKVFLKNNLTPLLPKELPFYTKPCADINGKDACYQEPCLSEHNFEQCSQAPGFWRLRQELPE